MESSEIDFRLLFESSPALLLVLTPDFRIAAVTDAYLRATHTKREKILGKNIFHVFPDNPDDPQATGVANLSASLERVIASGSADRMMIQKYDIPRPVHLGGGFEERFWQPLNTPMLDEKNSIRYIIHQVEDVTDIVRLKRQDALHRAFNEQLKREIEDRKRAEDALRLSERKFRLLIGVLPFGIWLLDEHGTVVYANEAAHDIWGRSKYVSREEYQQYKASWLANGKPLQPDEWAAVRALEYGEVVTGDVLRIQRQDGESRVIVNSAIPLFDDTGKIIGALVINQDITEQQKAEEALNESEKRFRSIIDNSMDAILLTSPDGRIFMANTAATELFGYAETEMRTFGREILFDPSDPRLEDVLLQRKKTGKFQGELMFRRKDGSRFPGEISSAVFKDEKGREWTYKFIRDITKRKLAEEEREQLHAKINEKKRWIEAVFELAPMGMLIISEREGNKVKPNKCARKIFGPEVDWSKGKEAVQGIVSEEESLHVLAAHELGIAKALAGEVTIGKEEVLCRADGSMLHVLENSGPIHDPSGKIIGAVSIFQDISKLRKTEQELAKALQQLKNEKRWLEAVFEGSPIGMVMVRKEDPEHPIPNKYAREIFGPKIDWKLGRTSYLGQALDAEGRVLGKDELTSSRVLRGETIIAEEQMLRFTDGREYSIVVAGGPINDDNGEQIGAVAFFQDISRLKELERLREEWSAVIAHDLRQPVTAIQLHAGVLRMHPDAPGKIRRIGEMIESSARNLNRMVNDLLEASQLEANKLKLNPQEVDVAGFLRNLIEKLKPLFPNNLIRLQVKENISVAHFDPGRIEQVIGNLISNASKYGYPQTEIILKAEEVDGRIEISVINQGKGIEQAELRKLFQRFHRTQVAKREGIKGIGLGLYITKGLVEAHGGRIHADSVPGERTTFRIELPSMRSQGSDVGQPRPA